MTGGTDRLLLSLLDPNRTGMQTRAYVRIIYIIMITWEQVPKHHEKKVQFVCFMDYIHKNLLYFFNKYKIRSKATNLKQ